MIRWSRNYSMLDGKLLMEPRLSVKAENLSLVLVSYRHRVEGCS
jgi:hypothetical protein